MVEGSCCKVWRGVVKERVELDMVNVVGRMCSRTISGGQIFLRDHIVLWFGEGNWLFWLELFVHWVLIVRHWGCQRVCHVVVGGMSCCSKRVRARKVSSKVNSKTGRRRPRCCNCDEHKMRVC